MRLIVTLLILTTHTLIAQIQIGDDIDGDALADNFGTSISMPNGQTIAIGAPQNDGNGTEAGQVKIFDWDGNQWTQRGGTINGENSYDYAGWSVSMPDANTVAIGAKGNAGTGPQAGHVRVFNWDGSQWIQKGFDIDGENSGDQCGYSVDMPDNNTIAVGAGRNDGNGTDAGHVRIFTWDSIQWVQKGLDIDGDSVGDESGYFVSMPNANTIAIGAPGNSGTGISAGHVRIFTWDGSQWQQKGLDIDSEAAGDQLGRALSMPDANTIAVGAGRNDGNGSNSGHVRVFSWSGGQWVQKGLDIDGENAGDQAGDAISMIDSNTLAIGAAGSDENGNSSGHVRIFVWNGSQWQQKGLDIDGENANDLSGYSVSMPNKGVVAIGALYNDDNGLDAGHVRVFAINGVYGSIYQDFNQNCIKESNETGLPNRILNITPGNIILQSNSNGSWAINTLPIGNYLITVDTSSLNWRPTCSASKSFSIIHPDSFINIGDIGFISTTACPAPQVSIHAPFLRPGFSNQKIYIEACNNVSGTVSINNAYVIVELDSLLTLNSSSTPYISLGNNQYQVNIGNVNPGQCVDFTFDCTLSLNAVLGQTLCMQAELYPVDSCALDSVPNMNGINCNTPWDKSSLQVEAYCNNDSVCFIIYNVGSGDMSCFSPVRLFIDGQLVLLDSVQLTSGASTQFCFAGDGRTWRLEADQHPLHPGNSNPNATVELCGNAQNWTPDLVNILPQDDADPVRDIYCGIVTGSYDPNDKTGYPLGIDSANLIQQNQDIEYLIRFQNTGTDTAFTVVIRDTLPQELNIFSVRSGVSSHAYDFRMYGPRVLEWTFNNILLPDSTTNEPESHGFVKFKVKQQPNLPLGTTIDNNAGIYFDFNPPIITNVYQHTIGNPELQNPEAVRTLQIISCDPQTINGYTYTQAGQYWQTVPGPLGDTIYNIEIIAPDSNNMVNLSYCNNYLLNNQSYSSSGTYTLLPNETGCADTTTLNLTLNESTDTILTVSTCGPYVYGGSILQNSGNYHFVIPNSVGCDSIIDLNLTILNTAETISVQACDSYMLNGQTYTASGVYTQQLTNSAGCDSTLTLDLTIESSLLIDEQISWDGLDLRVAQSGASYQWLDCDNANSPLAGATSQTFSPTNNGNYAVEISTANCTIVSPCFAVTNVSTISTADGLPLRVYPNPTRDQLVVELGDLEEAQLALYDARGRLLRSLLTSSSRSELSLKALPAGLYLLRVQANGQSQTVKVVKR